MRIHRFLPLLVSACAGVAAIAACTVDVDKYSLADIGQLPDASVPYASLRLEMIAMAPHTGEHFELRVVDNSNKVAAKAVLDKVIKNPATNSNDFSMFMKGFIPNVNGPYRLDYWFDHNQVNGALQANGKYDAPPTKAGDHSWRRLLTDPLPNGMAYHVPTYTLYFPHDSNWVNLALEVDQKTPVTPDFNTPTLSSFTVVANAPAEYVGKMFEYRVTQKASGQLVGLYRKTALEATNPGMTITDIVDDGTDYIITMFVDLNNDQILNPGEPSFSQPVTSGAGDFSATIDLGTADKIAIDNGNSNLLPVIVNDAGVIQDNTVDAGAK